METPIARHKDWEEMGNSCKLLGSSKEPEPDYGSNSSSFVRFDNAIVDPSMVVNSSMAVGSTPQWLNGDLQIMKLYICSTLRMICLISQLVSFSIRHLRIF
jgi:hypothetical protein